MHLDPQLLARKRQRAVAERGDRAGEEPKNLRLVEVLRLREGEKIVLRVDGDEFPLLFVVLDDGAHVGGAEGDHAVAPLLADRIVTDLEQRPLDRDAGAVADHAGTFTDVGRQCQIIHGVNLL